MSAVTARRTGRGPAVVLLPSLGRGAGDFDDIARDLEAGGFEAVAVDPQGVAGNPLPPPDATLHDLAAALAAFVETLDAPAHVAGHAFGNRVARCLAADRPDLVRSVTLLAAGGKVEPTAAVRQAIGRCVDTTLPVDRRRAALAEAMFAPGNDPSPWLDGWWPEAARAQVRAVAATPLEDWWTAGSAPVLVVQGVEDVAAPPENGRLLAGELGDRVRLVEVAGAGHALLPERPEEVAVAVLDFLHSFDGPRA